MKPDNALSPVIIIGQRWQGGTYILRLKIKQAVLLAFGRFKQGKQVAVPAGECVYVGSALGKRGAASLGRRLVRHATRSGQKAPHPIRALMLAQFKKIGLGEGDLRPKAGKRLHWHVDYLLDHPDVMLSNVIIIRSEARLENALARLLEADPTTFIIEKGLGANDARGSTHLLGVNEGEAWWEGVVEKMRWLSGVELAIPRTGKVISPSVW